MGARPLAQAFAHALAQPLAGPGALALPDPALHQRHGLHGDDRIWVEKNCYVDVWIGLLHALGLQPLAVLGGTVALDFLGDQWTFYKPSHDDLRAMYGVEVQELTLWRPLAEHVREHLDAGRLVSVEADAWWLPDTAATDYRRQHTKTTILIVRDEPQAERLTYFHNAGLYSLSGEDYRATLANAGSALPLFAEWIAVQRRLQRPQAVLRAMARQRLSQHLEWACAIDAPVARFAQRLSSELADLQQLGDPGQALATYHAWAFANTRQLGAAMELLALHLQWLGGHEAAAGHCLAVSQGAKTLILKLARAVVRPHSAAPDALLAEMHDHWCAAMAALKAGGVGSDGRP